MVIDSILERYEFIRRRAPGFMRQIEAAAAAAHNEAEFEHALNNAIVDVAAELGVDLSFRQEYTLATGRADAVYNHFVIEYKAPGSLRDGPAHTYTRHAVQQVRRSCGG